MIFSDRSMDTRVAGSFEIDKMVKNSIKVSGDVAPSPDNAAVRPRAEWPDVSDRTGSRIPVHVTVAAQFDADTAAIRGLSGLRLVRLGSGSGNSPTHAAEARVADDQARAQWRRSGSRSNDCKKRNSAPASKRADASRAQSSSAAATLSGLITWSTLVQIGGAASTPSKSRKQKNCANSEILFGSSSTSGVFISIANHLPSTRPAARPCATSEVCFPRIASPEQKHRATKPRCPRTPWSIPSPSLNRGTSRSRTDTRRGRGSAA